jgi:hypothetical protein
MLIGSSVTTLTIDRRIDIPAFLQCLANLRLRELALFRPIFMHVIRMPVFRDKRRRLHVVRFPIEIENFFLGTKEIFRVPVTFQAPRHAVRFSLINLRHMIDLAVTTEAADAAIDVRGMVIINVIGRAMDLYPLDGLVRFPTRADRLELRIVLLHLRVAIHARLRVRQIRMRRHVDKTMAVTTIHPKLRDVDIVRKGHWLGGLITDPGIFRRDVIPSPGRQTTDNKHTANGDFKRQPGRPTWKEVRHKTSGPPCCPTRAANLRTF